MVQILTEKELQDFALKFDNEIVRPLVNAGFAKYNIFDILNINRQELRHSDFLAFLLDPSKSGEVGFQFLRNFLTVLAKDIAPQLNFFNMLYGNIEKVNVSREVAVKNGRIDILIDIEITNAKKQKIVVAIENKVDTGEHDNQLGKYKEYLSDGKYKDHAKVMLYLSPDKAEPSDNEWTAIDYNFIYEILNRLDTATADSTIKTLVNDYKKTIRSEFGMDNNDELRQQAIEIYKNNWKVLDFIYSSKPDWRKETAKIIREVLKQHGAKLESDNQNVNIVFRTKELLACKEYLQIYIDELSLLFVNDKDTQICKKQWLFGDRQQSEEAVKRYQELALTDTAQLKTNCTQMLEQAFAKDGAITYCLSTLKN